MNGKHQYFALQNKARVSYPCPLKRLEIMGNSLTVSTPSTHVVVSKHHFQLEVLSAGSVEIGLIRGLGQEICKMSLEHLIIQVAQKLLWGPIKKEAGRQREEAPTGQRWDLLSIHKNNNCNGWKCVMYVQICKFTMILRKTEKHKLICHLWRMLGPTFFFFSFLLATLHGLQDLSSQTRD